MLPFAIKTFSLIFLGSAILLAQLPNLAKEISPNFVVPDAPAFKMLDGNPDNILRPSSVKDIGVSFSSFLGEENQITLPRTFAIEFSPGLLLNGQNLSITDYNNNAWWYRLRISLATHRDNQSSASNLAFGIRVATEDESDLRSNSTYINEATYLAQNIQDLIDQERKRLGPMASIEQIETLPGFIEQKEAFLKEFIKSGKMKNGTQILRNTQSLLN